MAPQGKTKKSRYNPKVNHIGTLMKANHDKEVNRQREEWLEFGKRFQGDVRQLRASERAVESKRRRNERRDRDFEAEQKRWNRSREEALTQERESELAMLRREHDVGRGEKPRGKDGKKELQRREKAVAEGEKALEKVVMREKVVEAREKALGRKEWTVDAREKALEKREERNERRNAFFGEEDTIIKHQWAELRAAQREFEEARGLSYEVLDERGGGGDSRVVVVKQ